MNKRTTSWMEQAWSALDSIPGASDVVAQERIRWQQFSGLNTLEVVVFGAYDAGKSTLLKRLLVDWNMPVPQWLTVSGRRETFESNRVEVKGFGLTDTAGLGSGNSDHDESTLAAMRLADAYLWVLPPQLVTTGKERFFEFIFGNTGIAEATIAVIGRMDEAGVDPSDSAEGFAEICFRKQKELASLIMMASAGQKLSSVHCVAADPYQMVGNTTDPPPQIYDTSRSWDGVEGLAQHILALRDQRDDLRSLAGVRFVLLLLTDVRRELRKLLDDLRLRKERLQNDSDRHELYEQRMDALMRQARADLHQRIEDALLSASRSCESGSVRGLEDRLSKVIDDWTEASFAKLRQLAAELETEVREHKSQTSMNGFRRLAQEVEEQEAREGVPRVDTLKVGRKVLALGPILRKAFERRAASELGMSLKVAADRLHKLETSGDTVEAFIKSQGRRASFLSAKHAEKASKFIKWARILDAVGPIVEQLGATLLDVGGEMMSAKRAEARAQQRLNLRSQLRAEAEKLEKIAAADFESTCNGLRQWLSQRRSSINSGCKSFSKEIDDLQKSINSMEDLIAAPNAS
jgi:hypothetical protein